jgi:hypothetical protein
LRQPLTERYRERLAGVLSCYDRIIVTGTLPGACYAKGMTGLLSARQIRIFDYPRFAEPLRDRDEPDWRIARIRLSDKTSRLHPRRATTKLGPSSRFRRWIAQGSSSSAPFNPLCPIRSGET